MLVPWVVDEMKTANLKDRRLNARLRRFSRRCRTRRRTFPQPVEAGPKRRPPLDTGPLVRFRIRCPRSR